MGPPVRGGIRDDFQSKICRVWRSTFFLGGGPQKSWHRTSRRTWCLEAIWDSLVSFPPKSLSLKKGCLGKKPLHFFHNTNQPPARAADPPPASLGFHLASSIAGDLALALLEQNGPFWWLELGTKRKEAGAHLAHAPYGTGIFTYIWSECVVNVCK